MTQKWAVIPWEKYVLEQNGAECMQTGEGESSMSMETLLLGIPKQARREATAILQHIQNTPNISWNLRGELIVNGEVLPNTHVTDLIKDSLYQYKKWKPKGIIEFYRALAESNLPLGLVRNAERRELLESFKNPRPPGIPAGKWMTWQ